MNRWVVKKNDKYLTARGGWNDDIDKATKFASPEDASEAGMGAAIVFTVTEVVPDGFTGSWAEIG